jgi:hypothetical protein
VAEFSDESTFQISKMYRTVLEELIT